MGYLSVSRFWDYQNADVWKTARKKGNGHPPWFKHAVHRDRALDELPPLARLLFYELLGAATRNSNVLKDDLNWLYAETRIDPETIAELLPLLLKGAWLSETQSPRRSRKPSRKSREDFAPYEEVEVDKNPLPPSGKSQASDWILKAGWQWQDVDLLDELGLKYGLDAIDKKDLLSLAQRVRLAHTDEKVIPLGRDAA